MQIKRPGWNPSKEESRVHICDFLNFFLVIQTFEVLVDKCEICLDEKCKFYATTSESKICITSTVADKMTGPAATKKPMWHTFLQIFSEFSPRLLAHKSPRMSYYSSINWLFGILTALPCKNNLHKIILLLRPRGKKCTSTDAR